MVSGFVPDERLGIFVVVVDEGSDGRFEFFGGAVYPAPELLFGQFGEPTFDQVEPTG